MKYKYAKTDTERQALNEDYFFSYKQRPDLIIEELNLDDLACNKEKIGLNGSPTKVRAIENVVIQNKNSQRLSGSDNDIKSLIKKLKHSHILE